jgi:hypothetical protein
MTQAEFEEKEGEMIIGDKEFNEKVIVETNKLLRVEQEKRCMRDECWKCKHQMEVPGDAHISCDKPDKDMTGNAHGIRSGWFFYPVCFDPVWKTKDCVNFEPEDK